MKAPAFPPDEVHRLDALRSLALLDTPPEADYDAIVQLARAHFSVPTCLLTLVDSDRQWFKARAGLEGRETSREISFCGHAILGQDVFVVLDASRDERFHDNPLVTGAPFIRFYAGAPIRIPSGYTIGTVCLLSPEPRAEFGARERSELMAFAGVALTTIATRALRAEADRARAAADRYQAVLHVLDVPAALLDHAGRVETCNEAFARLCAGPPEGQMAADMIPALGQAWTAGQPELASVTLPGRVSLDIMPDTAGYLILGKSAI